MSSERIAFNRENIDGYFHELAKEFRKLNGKSLPAEIILIGGAAVIANYGFREMTYDVDAIILASSAMKEAANRISDKFGLPNGWLNSDFTKTNSYSAKLIEHSTYYKTFSNVLSIRAVSGEYLIAMKLMAGRKYKYDLSDVAGILLTHANSGDFITLEHIKSAVTELYGSWEAISEYSSTFISNLFLDSKYENMYTLIREEEELNKSLLIDFENKYPGVTTVENVDDILSEIIKRDESQHDDIQPTEEDLDQER